MKNKDNRGRGRRPIHWEWDNIIVLNPETTPGYPCAICNVEPDNREHTLELILGDDLKNGRVVVCERCARSHAETLMDALDYTERIKFAEDIEHLMGVIWEVKRVRTEMQT